MKIDAAQGKLVYCTQNVADAYLDAKRWISANLLQHTGSHEHFRYYRSQRSRRRSARTSIMLRKSVLR